VFENRVLRRIFGPKRDKLTGGWRKLHNEELHNLYYSPSIIRMIKSKRIKCVGHVVRTGRMHIGVLRENEKERRHYEDLYVVGWIILKQILEKHDGVVWTGGGLF
jgi:hypothetical protein